MLGRVFLLAFLGFLAFLIGVATAQSQQMCANDLVRQVVNNELKIGDQDRSHWMYRRHTEKQNAPKQEEEVVETSNGSLTRPILIDGRQPTAEEQQKAEQHIQQLASDPSEPERSSRQRKEEQEHTDRMFRMLPDALNFTYAEERGDLVKLTFVPNPQFRAPTREAEVFHALQGFMWVDRKQNRLGEISGRLVRKVKFGGGLLGHLDEGGTFDVKKEEVAPGSWKMTVLSVNMTGRVLFFKAISEQQKESRGEFKRLPDDLTVAQAAELLQKQVISQLQTGTGQAGAGAAGSR